MRRNLGDEVFERLIEPFCSGYNGISVLPIKKFPKLGICMP